jgi:HSP20 family molecular chaperone IbpA
MATVTTAAAPARREPREPREMRERAARTIAPRVDIYETEKAFVLLADMPGVTAEGLEVVAERSELIIRGRVERPETPPDYQEFELADYHRTFLLTEDLDTEGINAALRDGVLRVEIPRSPLLQPKKIPVRTE